MQSDLFLVWQYAFDFYQRLIYVYESYFISRLAIGIIVCTFLVSLIGSFLKGKNSAD